MVDSNLHNLVDSLLTKICHDLINPLGSAQMAIEENEPNYLESSIKEAILKIDMYRFLYRNNIEDDLQSKKFQEYLSKTKQKVSIEYKHKKISSLLFFLSEKMLNKSYIEVKEDKILLEYMFFHEKEINGLNGNFEIIDPFNVMLYLAYLQYKPYYKARMENLENNKWMILIEKI